MGQITLYLDQETERKMRRAAKSSGISPSSWVANLIREKTLTKWPDHVQRLAGAWTDLPTAETLRKTFTVDSQRIIS